MDRHFRCSQLTYFYYRFNSLKSFCGVDKILRNLDNAISDNDQKTLTDSAPLLQAVVVKNNNKWPLYAGALLNDLRIVCSLLFQQNSPLPEVTQIPEQAFQATGQWYDYN